MASNRTSRTSPFLTLPHLDLGMQGDSTADHPTPIPIPSPSPVHTDDGPRAPSRPPASPPSRTDHRFLTPREWSQLAHAIGAVADPEDQQPLHPSSWVFPPRGLAPGLYRDVVLQRTKYRVLFHTVSTCRGTLMILQVVLGAVLTALGTVKKVDDGTPITVIAVIQTVIAGVLALIHNSGLPDRYRSNKYEFAHIENYIRELLDTRIVEYDQELDDVIIELYNRFERANVAVQANQPASYVSSQSIVRPTHESPPSRHLAHMRS